MRASDISVMAAGHRKCHQLRLVEDGHEHVHIGEVGAARERVVVDEHIAAFEPVPAEPLDHRLGAHLQGAEMHRDSHGGRDKLAICVQ